MKPPREGAGFDTSLTDGLGSRFADVIGNASAPDERPLDMTGLARSMWPDGLHEHWQFVQGPENHDIVYRPRATRGPAGRSGRSALVVRTQPRPGRNGDRPDGTRHSRCCSWARSFSRTSSGPTTSIHKNLLLYWAGLDDGDKQMLDHLRFTREL